MFIHDKVENVYIGNHYYLYAVKETEKGDTVTHINFKLGKNRKEDLSYIVKYNDMKVNDEQDSRNMS